MNSSPNQRRPRSGCLLVLMVCVISCLLLVLNGVLVAYAYGVLLSTLPSRLANPKLAQIGMFVLPVVLLLLEWSLLDSLFKRLRRPQG